jgi:seryl-tRNA synthetase
MLDIQFIRENVDLVTTAARNKGLDPTVVDQLLIIDQKRRELISQTQEIRTKRNKLNEKLKTTRTPELIKLSQQLKAELKEIEPQLKAYEAQFEDLLLRIPNVPSIDVPVGKDEQGNVVARTIGSKPNFDFVPKDHIQLGLDLDILDLDRGSKVAGYRGYFLKNAGVLMHYGIMRYALDKLIKKGFIPMLPPIVDRKEAFINSGHFPWGEGEAYALYPEDPDNKNKLTELGGAYPNYDYDFKSDTYLAGTAEVPLVSYHAGELLQEKDLPKLYAGFSPCFRREIGSYGKDTRGIYRVHEFMKIEQVILCVNDWAESEKWHEALASYAEEMLQELGLHYQVLLMCTGDMGEPQVKKYDIETWMPGRNAYGETMSDSIMGEFQARRANIRYQAKDGTIKYVHMLNNTALASPRILLALWENYQQKDGSIKIPEVLIPYVGLNQVIHA